MKSIRLHGLFFFSLLGVHQLTRSRDLVSLTCSPPCSQPSLAQHPSLPCQLASSGFPRPRVLSPALSAPSCSPRWPPSEAASRGLPSPAVALLEARSPLLSRNVLTAALMLAISASLSSWLLGKTWSSYFGFVSLSLAGHSLLFDLAVVSLGCDCVGFLLRTLRVHQF